MMDATRQLEQVRQIARWLLLAQRLIQLVWVSAGALVLCGLLDYTLRLPGWVRLGMGLSVSVAVGGWFAVGLFSAVRFRPGLSVLALRAERFFPALAGVLASGVELAAGRSVGDNNSPATSALARHSVAKVQHQLKGLSLKQLIDPGRTLRMAWVIAVVLTVLVGFLVAAPQASRLAVNRWIDPLGPARWPNRTRVHSLVTSRAWASDTPMRLGAMVDSGYHPDMRTWVVYRLTGKSVEDRSWRRLLMNRQTQENEPPSDASSPPRTPAAAPTDRGVFERLVDLTEPLASNDPQALPSIEFYFSAGDDRTPTQTVSLVQRPSVLSVAATIQPPPYARGLVHTQQPDLDQQMGQVVTVHALEGSTIDLHITFNKPIQTPVVGWDGFLPGLAAHGGRTESVGTPDAAGAIRKSFVIDKTIETPIHVVDQHGFGNLSERLYRFVAVKDNPPVVAMVQPTADEAVLPTALVNTEAAAHDDVGVDRLVMKATVTGTQDPPDPSKDQAHVLAETSGRPKRLHVQHKLDLTPFGLQPGNEVVLVSVADDVFEINGLDHEPVESSPRRLKIITAATLMSQIRTELATVRQQAIGAESRQQRLFDRPAQQAVSPQQQVTVSVGAQESQITAAHDRLKRNRLDPDSAEPLHQLVQRAAALSAQAKRSSRDAHRLLEKATLESGPSSHHRVAAHDQQKETSRLLTGLIELLDQGRDALDLQLQLQQLQALQQALAGETRQLMPLTLGWSVDQLSKPERQKLADIAQRQDGVAKLAGALLQRMQATSEALSRQGDELDDQASAQVLAEAASVARRHGLVRALRQAAEKARNNQLSDADSNQQTGLDLIEQMLAELGRVQQRHQVILRRRLMELTDRVRKLIQRQQDQLDRLTQVVDTTPLDLPLLALRRNTMAVAKQANATPQTQEAGAMLDEAVDQQSAAVGAVRQSQRAAARGAQDRALAHLKQALGAIEKIRDAAHANQTRKQRQELRQAYEALAVRQEALRTETQPLIDSERLSRRQRAASLRLGHQQTDLQIATQPLQSQVEKTLMFTYLHTEIQRQTSAAASRLRSAQPDQTVLDHQDSVALMLRQMAQALIHEPPDSPFAAAHSSSGGGGGGASGASLVPPLAELKLLRSIQQQVYHQTQQLDQQPGNPNPTKQALAQLSDRQRELASLGQKLMQMVRSRQGPPPG